MKVDDYLNNKWAQQVESLMAICQSDGAMDANDAELWPTIGLPYGTHRSNGQISPQKKRKKDETETLTNRRKLVAQFQSIQISAAEFNRLQLIGFNWIGISLRDFWDKASFVWVFFI